MEEAIQYKIADFPVTMNCRSAYMKRLCGPYTAPEKVPVELNLCLSDEGREKGANNQLSPAMYEYNYTFYQFFSRIIERNAFCFHAAALSVDGEGILFSADSGTGKSTHARLWEEFMADHEVVNLNDDKPVIRLLDGKPWVYGSPWSGKHAVNHNGRAPVKALVFLERGESNQIQQVPQEKAFPLVFSQVIGGKKNRQQVAQLIGLLDQFIRHIAVYRLQCNISGEAVRLVYDTVWKE